MLTVRLAEEEIALLSALRHAITEDISQADVMVWALEDLCHRVATGEPTGSSIRPDGPAVCVAAEGRLEKARHSVWFEDRRGRPPRLTASDQQAISALREESGEGVTNS